MLVPLSWLKKYVKIDLSVEEFVRRMIMSGTAVEGYEDCGAEISNVVVGKLVEIVKHPNSSPWPGTTATCPAACTSPAASCAAKCPTA